MSYKEILDEVIKNNSCDSLQNDKLKFLRNEDSFKYLNECKADNNGWIYKELGCHYQFGYGVEGDKDKAQMYYEKSANLGNACAINNLAICYQNGIGVKKDIDKAIRLYEQSANLDNSYAMYNLAICYGNGLGVEKDPNKAVKLYKQSAELGNADAMYNLAIYYEEAGDNINACKLHIKLGKLNEKKSINKLKKRKFKDITVLLDENERLHESNINLKKLVVFKGFDFNACIHTKVNEMLVKDK
jgi:TPR repeat protein